MRVLRKASVVALALTLLALLWVWWNRFERVDMAAYVPADSVVYLEADGLKNIFDGLTATDAWREFAPRSGAGRGFGGAGWLSRLASLGVGSSEAVVAARAQVAVTILGFKAEEGSDATLTFSPRGAIVAETHSSEWRARAAVEKLAGDFARRSLESPAVEKKEFDGVPATVWAEPAGSKRKLIAAVREGAAVIGNDEAAVRACLDVRRGARQSLAGNEQLNEMRARLDAGGALAFGFAQRGSAAKAVEVFAPAFVGNVSEESKVQSLLATLLPQLVNQVVGEVGWSSRVVGGRVEDRYLLTLPGTLAERLRAPFAPAASRQPASARLLPADAHQVTFYNLRNPEMAWRGLGAALSSQVDVSRAAMITLGLESLLKPYGIERPRDFLRAAGSELATASLDAESERRVLVVETLDREAVRAQVLKQLGAGARATKVGDGELFVSEDPEAGAAGFASEYVILGDAEDVRRCLVARQEGRTFVGVESFKATLSVPAPQPPLAQTLTNERVALELLADSLSRSRERSGTQAEGGGDGRKPAREFYAVSETRLTEDGFEKVTRSAYGLLGEVFARLARPR